MTFLCQLTQSQTIADKVNLSGMERSWDSPRFKSAELIREIKNIQKRGYKQIRLPVALSYHLHSNPRFLSELESLIQFTEKEKLQIILCNFDSELNRNNWQSHRSVIKSNWLSVLKKISFDTKYLAIELVNEPLVNPDTWENILMELLPEIREVKPDIPIIIGATNYNSLYELSRMRPLTGFGNIIYTFHFYEPFIFTHQGTQWTGNQNATKGIPYPFEEGKMPSLNPKAKGTAGEINLRDYYQTGNMLAVEDKIRQISDWALRNQVALWCTEYGVSKNADPESRKRYLEDVSATLDKYRIPGFIWEWEGNFGIKSLIHHSKSTEGNK